MQGLHSLTIWNTCKTQNGGQGAQNWRTGSPTIQNLQTGHLLRTWNLAPRLNSQNQDQVTTAVDGQPTFPGWSPTIFGMVTHHPKDDHLQSLGCSTTTGI